MTSLTGFVLLLCMCIRYILGILRILKCGNIYNLRFKPVSCVYNVHQKMWIGRKFMMCYWSGFEPMLAVAVTLTITWNFILSINSSLM